MQTRFYIVSGLAVAVSFACGFFLANSLNRAEIRSLANKRAASANGASSVPKSDESGLSEKEIEKKLAEAERNVDDFAFQKGLGLALYQYAAFKGDRKRLEDVRVLLSRAYSSNPDDYQVIVALANVNFDLGQIRKDEKLNIKARELYQNALKKNPKDTHVLGDLGTTYMETSPPEPRKAIPFLDKSFDSDGRNEKVAVQLAKANLLLKDLKKANEYLEKLKALNPRNPEIGRIQADLEAGGVK